MFVLIHVTNFVRQQTDVQAETTTSEDGIAEREANLKTPFARDGVWMKRFLRLSGR